MARTQGSAFQTVSLDEMAPGAAVYEDPLVAMAENHNWIWASWQPTIASIRTPGDASDQYRTLASGTGKTDVYALRIPMVNGRTVIAAHPRLKTGNNLGAGSASVFGMRSAAMGAESWYAATGTSNAWRTYNTAEWTGAAVATREIQASSGFDVVTFGLQSDAGSGAVNMRHLEVHWHPYSGDLPSGNIAGDYYATDDGQWDGNAPNSCGLYTEASAGLASLRGLTYWPVLTYMDGLRDSKVALSANDAQYETVLGPIPILSREGENVSSYGYSLLATRAGGTGTDNKIEVSLQRGTEYSSNAIDSNEHTAAAPFAAAPARPWETASTWSDGELDAGNGSARYLFIRMKSDGTYSTQLHSIAVWAKGRV